MAVYRIEGPDGSQFDIEGPDDASEQEISAFAEQQFSQQPQQASAQPEVAQPQSANPDPAYVRRARGLAQTTIVPAAQLMSRGLAAAAPLADKFSPEAGDYLRSLPEGNDQFAEQLRSDAKAGSPEGFDLASLEGQAVGSLAGGGLKVLQGVKTGAQWLNRAAQGGLMGGQMAPTNDESVTQNVTTGAAVNTMLPPFARFVAQVVRPSTSSNAAKLVQEGVKLTPGQIIGGAAKKMEDAATSIPGLGDVIGAAQRRSFESFNRVAAQRALTPIGEKLPDNLKGREAVTFVQDKLGQAYETLLPKLKADADGAFMSEIVNLQQMARNLPEPQAQMFNRILADEVLSKFTQYGKMSGDTMKQVQTRLRQFVTDSRKSDNTYVRDLGDGLSEVAKSLREVVKRSNPGEAGKLEKIDAGYAQFKRVQAASSRTTSQDGIFTPDAYNAAVRALDKSKDKSAFAKGRALGQDLSESARGVMGSRVPDSGTARRLLTGAVATGGAGMISPGALIGVGAAALPYLPGGRKVTEALLLRRPPGANALARGITAGAKFAPAALPASNALLYSGN